MQVPTVKPTKFTFETKEILNNFSKEMNSDTAKNSFLRLHKDNSFNKRFSGLLDAFSDVETVTERMTENIQASITLGSQMQNTEEIDQDLYKQEAKLTKQNKTDLKNLYVNTRIFLDEYTIFLCWFFDWEIQESSIAKFYYSLKEYNGSDKCILRFKEENIERLGDIHKYISEYRNNEVVHNKNKHEQDTKWFINEMNGAIRFGGGSSSSVTPQEVLFLMVDYIDYSNKLCFDWLNVDSASKP